VADITVIADGKTVLLFTEYDISSLNCGQAIELAMKLLEASDSAHAYREWENASRQAGT
jgi:hypothetical protein